ncbi:MAG: CHAT domain-containing tetratricopeptide repeat protein [Blastocatellia bacterium]
MAPGQFLRIVVKQQGIDVVVSLSAPDSEKIAEADSNHLIEGSETVSAISESAGAYLIELRSAGKTAKAGRYEIKVEELRVATAEDRHRVAGDALSREAGLLQSGTLEAKRKAIEKYHEALDLYRRASDHKGEANTLHNIGTVHRSLGDLRKAMEKYNEALPIRRAAGDRGGEAGTLNNIGTVYYFLGEMRKALEKYNEALPIRRAAGDRGGEATTLNNIGAIHRSLGDARKALEKHNEALPIFREVGDRDGEANALINIGITYQSLGDMRKALENYNEALPIFREVGNRGGEANTLTNIGVVYWSLGDMQKALESYNEALSIFQEVGGRRGEAAALTNIGIIYYSLGEMRKALEKHNEALPIIRKVGDRNVEANTLTNIGVVYHSLGDLRKALEKYNEALPIKRAVGDRYGEAAMLLNIGMVYYSLGEMRKALEKYNEALPINRTIGGRYEEAAILHNIGEVYKSLGETQKALEKYNEALPIRRAVGDRSGEAVTLLGIGQVEQRRGDLIQARQTIEQAVGIIELLRTNPNSQELRASYFATHQEFYQSYIGVLMQMHKQNPDAAFDAVAFAVSERARARSLLELLAEARADIRQGVDSSLLERERSLLRRLNARATAQLSLLSGKHTTEQADAAAKEIASITTEYEELRAQIRVSSPRYGALTQPQPLNLAEIQQQALDPDTLLLEYSLGDNASYLFVVSQTSIASYQLPKRAEIEAATRRAHELLTAPQPRPGETAAERQARVKEARANYWPQAAVLSQMLLGPAASQLGAKRLLIVADGVLQYVPFGALPSPVRNPQSATRNPQSYTPLIVEHEIVHLPSASALAVLRRELAGRQPAAKAVAVLADPVFSVDDARVKLGNKAQAGKETPSDLTRAVSAVRVELRRLLMTRDEAEAILSVTPRNVGFAALDFRANRATAASSELSSYRIVHFATHGLLNSEHPELSGLVLSLVDEQGRPQDGFLRMHEIFNLRLPAELVVLSACQTGLGKEIKGEGLVGLTRGFMYAGAARVVASLWEVNDAATAELMKRFYRRMLQDGMRPAAALRAAQIEMWKKPQWQSPFYWGAFVLQGEWK